MDSRPRFIPLDLTLLLTSLLHLCPFSWACWWVSAISNLLGDLCHQVIFWDVSNFMNLPKVFFLAQSQGRCSLPPYLFLHQLHHFVVTHHSLTQWRRKLGRYVKVKLQENDWKICEFTKRLHSHYKNYVPFPSLLTILLHSRLSMEWKLSPNVVCSEMSGSHVKISKPTYGRWSCCPLGISLFQHN